MKTIGCKFLYISSSILQVHNTARQHFLDSKPLRKIFLFSAVGSRLRIYLIKKEYIKKKNMVGVASNLRMLFVKALKFQKLLLLFCETWAAGKLLHPRTRSFLINSKNKNS